MSENETLGEALHGLAVEYAAAFVGVDAPFAKGFRTLASGTLLDAPLSAFRSETALQTYTAEALGDSAQTSVTLLWQGAQLQSGVMKGRIVDFDERAVATMRLLLIAEGLSVPSAHDPIGRDRSNLVFALASLVVLLADASPDRPLTRPMLITVREQLLRIWEHYLAPQLDLPQSETLKHLH